MSDPLHKSDGFRASEEQPARCFLLPWKLLAELLLGLLSILPLSPCISPVEAAQPPMSALYLMNQPADYEMFEELVKSYRDTGADTMIIRPIGNTGVLDRKILAKSVFFAHAAGLKLYVLLPTRGIRWVLAEHPDWQDVRYDVRTGRLEPCDKLDLFNPHVTVYLTDLFRDIAEYSIDGIILDEDYYYSDTEGMSGRALAGYRQKFGSSFPLRKALGQVSGELPQDHAVDRFGEAFWRLAELKKAKLLLLLQNIMQASRAVNKQIVFGVTLHVPGLFLEEKELLAWYSHDLKAFRKVDVNFFWLALPHRDIRAQKDINYKKSIETVSRIAVSSLSLVNDPARIVFAVQTVAVDGKPLSISEIEEVTTQVRKTGDTGIAFMVVPDSGLSADLTRKIFKGRPEQL